MVEHLVLFQWKPDASSEAIAAAMTALQGLPAQIPEIVDLSCGENFSDRSSGFQHGLVVRLRDRADLETYRTHPAHQAVVREAIAPILAQILALDYEFER